MSCQVVCPVHCEPVSCEDCEALLALNFSFRCFDCFLEADTAENSRVPSFSAIHCLIKLEYDSVVTLWKGLHRAGGGLRRWSLSASNPDFAPFLRILVCPTVRLSWYVPWGWWKDKDRWPNLMQLMSLSRHAKHELLTCWLSLISLISWISFVHLISYRHPRGFGPLLHCSRLNLPPLFLIVLVPLADSGMESWPCMQKHSSAIQVCEGIQHLHSNGLLP